MQVQGAKALVTGAGRGIGRAIAVTLARAGADLTLAARTRKELEDVAAEVRGLGVAAHVFPCDMCVPSEVRSLAVEAEKVMGRVDLLVNNAGGGTWASVVEMKEAEFEQTIELNLTSVFRLTKHLLPGMLARGKGHIVMIASTSARRGGAGSSAYSAAKFGLNGFAQSLFYETRKRDVRVTTIYPSTVNTSLVGSGGEENARMIQSADIAQAVLFAVEAADRSTIKEIEVWQTNP